VHSLDTEWIVFCRAWHAPMRLGPASSACTTTTTENAAQCVPWFLCWIRMQLGINSDHWRRQSLANREPSIILCVRVPAVQVRAPALAHCSVQYNTHAHTPIFHRHTRWGQCWSTWVREPCERDAVRCTLCTAQRLWLSIVLTFLRRQL